MTRIRATVTWDLAKFEKRVDQILENFGPLISFQLQEEISKDQFVYTNDEGDEVGTRRENRQVVGSPRDIVDTGQLLTSQSTPEVGGGMLTIRWTAPYSLAAATKLRSVPPENRCGDISGRVRLRLPNNHSFRHRCRRRCFPTAPTSCG